MGDETDDGDDKVMRLASAHNTLDKERLSKIRARLKSSILTTTCAVCARPLDDTFHRCDRCETRYCSADCERGDSDHSEYCEDTHELGGPFLLWACRLFFKHQRLAIAECKAPSDAQCYICWEGGDLVRGCSCRGNFGLVHMACLIKHANSILQRPDWSILEHYSRCLYCEQKFHGSVACVMAVMCWSKFVDYRPERDEIRLRAMEILADGLRLGDEFAAVLLWKALCEDYRAKDKLRLLINKDKYADALIKWYPRTKVANQIKKTVLDAHANIRGRDRAINRAREIGS